MEMIPVQPPDAVPADSDGNLKSGPFWEGKTVVEALDELKPITVDPSRLSYSGNYHPDHVSVADVISDAYSALRDRNIAVGNDPSTPPTVEWYREFIHRNARILIQRAHKWLDEFQIKPTKLTVAAWPHTRVGSAIAR